MNAQPKSHADAVVMWLLVGLILIGAALTLLPFLPAILWGAVLAISLGPVQKRMDVIGCGRRLAAVLSAAFLIVLLIPPALILTHSMAIFLPDVITWIENTIRDGLPAPPNRLLELPLIGAPAHDAWGSLSKHGSVLLVRFEPEIRSGVNWIVLETGVLGTFVLEFAFAILIAGVALAKQEPISRAMHSLVQKAGGSYGLEMMAVVIDATRSVVCGIIGSALAQAIVATFAYAIAGVPAWPILGALTFVAATVVLGAPLVWLPVSLWLWAKGEPGWAIFVFAWGLIVVTLVEQTVRPLLISKRIDLPLPVTFIGVLGGLLKWGIVGIFIGPVVLAVAYHLVLHWIDRTTTDTSTAD